MHARNSGNEGVEAEDPCERKRKTAPKREEQDQKFDELIEQVLRVRDEPPYFTDEDIRGAREELRK